MYRFILISLLLGSYSFGQKTDELWTGIGVTKSINSRLDATLDLNNRVYNSTMQLLYPEVTLKYKVTKWFKQSNTLVIKSLSDHRLLKKEKGVPKFAQLRQLFMTSQMSSIINGDHGDIDLDTAKSTWDRPPAPSRPPGPRTLDSRTKAPSCLLRHRAPYLPRLLDPQKPRR